jgi:hypothetical protein
LHVECVELSGKRWRTDTANQRGGSEWEPIKILLEGDGNSYKMNTASNTHLRLTTQAGKAHVATGVPLDLGTNTHTLPTRERSGTPNFESTDPHRSDRWAPPVRSVPAGETEQLSPVRPIAAWKPPRHQTGQPTTKLTQTRNRSNTGQQRTHQDVHPIKIPPGLALVRPV